MGNGAKGKLEVVFSLWLCQAGREGDKPEHRAMHSDGGRGKA
jgi:hypothetical protein